MNFPVSSVCACQFNHATVIPFPGTSQPRLVERLVQCGADVNAKAAGPIRTEVGRSGHAKGRHPAIDSWEARVPMDTGALCKGTALHV